MADMRSCGKKCMELKGENIHYLALTEEVCQLCCASPTFLPEGLIWKILCMKAWIQDTSFPPLGFSRKMILNDVWIVHYDDNKTCDCLPPNLWKRGQRKITGSQKRP